MNHKEAEEILRPIKQSINSTKRYERNRIVSLIVGHTDLNGELHLTKIGVKQLNMEIQGDLE